MFQPGQSGNPNGRPKMPEHIREAFRKLDSKAVKVLEDILDGTDETAKAADRVKASQLVIERNYGKPVQEVDQTITERRPIVYDDAWKEGKENG